MFTAQELLKATGAKLISGLPALRIDGISIDTRTLRKGDIFIALKGTTHDGHAFSEEALKKGASGLIVASRYGAPQKMREFARRKKAAILVVKDTMKAFGDIAQLHRMRFDIPVLAVTGSNGKTTTKEMIAGVLKKKWSPLRNSGTQNNLIGVPLTLLKLRPKHPSAVLELGANRTGEIRRLSEISSPNFGVITNIGPSHLEYLGSLQGVYRAKKELLDFLGEGDIALLNGDDVYLRRFRKQRLNVATFGIKSASDFRAEDIKKDSCGWSFRVKGMRYSIPLPAYHDVYNALAAIAVGYIWNVPYHQIKDVLSNHTPLANRMNRCHIHGIQFIDDTYNSNPLSMEDAIKTLTTYSTHGRKTLVSGDMLELGKRSPYYHNRIGRLVARSGIHHFIGIGDMMRGSLVSAKRYGMRNVWPCKTKEEAALQLKRIVKPKDVVLVKGSRAMKMEDVIECFTTSYIR